jgi:hypothetical protein
MTDQELQLLKTAIATIADPVQRVRLICQETLWRVGVSHMASKLEEKRMKRDKLVVVNTFRVRRNCLTKLK